MRNRAFTLCLALPALACSAEAPVPTNGFEERAIDRDVRHGQGFRVTDLDGDGRLDVVAALSLTDAVHAYVRTDPEDPEVLDWTRISVSGPNQIVAMDVDVGDLDGDGDLDIAAVGLFQREAPASFAASPGEVVWYENPGDVLGVWTTHEVSVPDLGDAGYVGGIYGARTVRLADFDGDGDLDLTVGALESLATRFDYDETMACVQFEPLGNGIYWFDNRGDGKFDGPARIDPDLAGVSQVKVGDVDADGRVDLVATAATTQSVVWYRNTAGASGPRFERRTLATGGGAYFGLEVANLDADPALEIVSAVARNNGGYVHMLDAPSDLGANPGALWTTSTITAGIGATACEDDEGCPRAADLCATVQVCTGTVAEPADACVPAEVCDNGEDDSGDGLVDCEDPTCGVNPACAECTDSLQCANTPADQMQAIDCASDDECPRVVDVCADGYCPATVVDPIIVLADFSGDGQVDLVVAEAGGLLQRYYQFEGGGWERRDIRTGFVGLTFLGAGDVDGDGRVDLLSSTYELGTRDRISWWKNLGN